MINIKFPDGSVRTYEAGVTGYDVAMSISPRLAADVLAVSVKKPGEPETSKGTTIDLLRPINEDVELRLLKWEDDEAKKVFWHSSSHLMAEALERSARGPVPGRQVRHRPRHRERFLL